MKEEELKQGIKEYNEIMKKNEILMKRYKELEAIEKKLKDNKKLSPETRLKNQKKLLEEYTKISNLLTELTKQADVLNKKIEEE